MLIRSSYPVRYPSTIPSDRLTRLIPRATLTDLLYPSFPFTVIDIDHAEGPPRWFSDLEPWYELFCPELWVYLERDEASSLALEASYEAYAQELEDLGEDSAEAMARLEEDSHEVTAERFNCWAAIYALHGLRKAFLEFHRSADAPSEQRSDRGERVYTIKHSSSSSSGGERIRLAFLRAPPYLNLLHHQRSAFLVAPPSLSVHPPSPSLRSGASGLFSYAASISPQVWTEESGGWPRPDRGPVLFPLYSH